MKGTHRLYGPGEAGWSEAQVSLSGHWPPLPAPYSTPPPGSSLQLPVASSSAALSSAPLCSAPLQEGHLLPALLLPLLLLSPLTALASRGWGPQGWTHPTVAPEPSWSDGHTVGRRTQEPRGGQCARVPHSLLKVSASWGCSHSGVLETFGACPRPLVPDLRPQSRLLPQVYLRQAGPGGKGNPCVHKLAQVRGSVGRGPRLGAGPSPAHRGLTGDTPHRPWGAKIGKWRVGGS